MHWIIHWIIKPNLELKKRTRRSLEIIVVIRYSHPCPGQSCWSQPKLTCLSKYLNDVLPHLGKHWVYKEGFKVSYTPDMCSYFSAELTQCQGSWKLITVRPFNKDFDWNVYFMNMWGWNQTGIRSNYRTGLRGRRWEVHSPFFRTLFFDSLQHSLQTTWQPSGDGPVFRKPDIPKSQYSEK